MINKYSDIDEFKRALTMAMRSISKQGELTVSFGADKGNLSGLKARLPMPNKNMDNDQINSLRGEADSLALYLRHHKEIIDKKYEPQGQNARGIYNILEKVRCDAIGANSMSGVSKNLHQMEINQTQRLIDYLDVVKTPHREAFEQAKLKNDFKHFWAQYDNRRAKTFSQTFPKELTDWYNTL